MLELQYSPVQHRNLPIGCYYQSEADDNGHCLLPWHMQCSYRHQSAAIIKVKLMIMVIVYCLGICSVLTDTNRLLLSK